MTSKAAVRRRLVGQALRHYRNAFGFTVEDVAELVGCDLSKISRVETGQRGIKGEELRELLEWYGAPETEQDMLLAVEESTRGARPDWWQDYPAVLSGARLEYMIIEQYAARVLAYAPQTVPDLLQTAGYATCLAAATLAVPEGRETDAADIAQLRQRRLVETGRVELDAVIGEAALRLPVGDGQTMREQLQCLYELASGGRRVTVRVLRSLEGVPAAQGAGAFAVLRFDTPYPLGLVRLDGPGSGLCLDERAAVDAYARAFIHLQSAALSPADSLDFIRRLTRG